ncbi:4407_t:CDS:2 [Dentiscutata heterogama]|uniref:4407_t:CDS:1 n=1 Tax=Dentiscutata heterogama TaxID=1316150 RepID=A0ACA9LR06_9GLOM|nr:4407_t:CDS:2 [Dentiscutata heterogama]
MYDIFEPPYNYSFMEGVETPQTCTSCEKIFSVLKFERVMENYANMVEFDDDMFNNNIEDEELDADYISDTENLDDLLQFDSENLKIEEMLDFSTFLDKQTNEITYNNLELEDDEYDYDID